MIVMHKLLAMTMAAAMMAAPTLAQSDLTEKLGVPGPITFQDLDYALAWTSAPTGGHFKQEYVPAGQVVETYTDMFLIEAVLGLLRPLDAAGAQVQSLQQREEIDPVVNYDIQQNEETGEVLLDFVLSDLSADPIVMEWNAYRYVPLADGEGVVLYGISHRGYGDNGAKALLENLKTIRMLAVMALATAQLPLVTAEE